MTLSYVFFGTPECSVSVLDLLIASGHPPLALVAQPDRPKGRGCLMCCPPTKDWANEHRVRVLQPDKCKDEEFLQAISALKPDLGVVFAYGKLLPRSLLAIPRLGFINIHPSLLPRYRGAAPIQWALINGDPETGVSILKVTPRFDDGDILLQESTAITLEENAEQLSSRLAALGARLTLRVLEKMEGGDFCALPQNEDSVIWAPELTKEDGDLDWTQTALALHNRIRGLYPWPGAYTHLDGKVLKIHRARPLDTPSPHPAARPGQVVRADKDDLWVQTGQGLLALLGLQLEGRKRLDAREFLLGRVVGEDDILQ